MNLIEKYIDSKKHAWADTTRSTAQDKLQSLLNVLDGDPERLWQNLQHLAPYSRATVWTLVIGYWDWYLKEIKNERSENSYRTWREINRRQFKYVYQRKPAQFSYNEVRSRISHIEDNNIRNRAFKMLSAGLRFCESGQGDRDSVRGKGSKTRRVYGLAVHVESDQINYHQFRRALQKVGLKSHDLRKAFATELVRQGANVFEICKIMGWNSIETAQSYINVEETRTEELVRKVQNG